MPEPPRRIVKFLGTPAYERAIYRLARAINRRKLAIDLPEDDLPKILDWCLCHLALTIGGFKMPARVPTRGGPRSAGPGKKIGRPRKPVEPVE